MKFDSYDVQIIPDNDCIELFGPSMSDAPGVTLKGTIKLWTSKPIKIRSLVVKFKGFNKVRDRFPGTPEVDIQSTLYPKIKSEIFSKTTSLTAAHHSLPWELEIPNLFPRSLSIKRAQVHYMLQVEASIGLHKKTLIAECPIIVQRHLLRYKELIPLMPTKAYRQTIPGKFHYEIECPRLLSLEQSNIPLAVKYLDIASQPSVRAIHTQILQVELYRVEALSKTDVNLERHATQTGSQGFGASVLQAIKSSPKCVKLARRKGPMLTHVVDAEKDTSWTVPLVLEHTLDNSLLLTTEAPHVAIQHQLEVTFDRGSKFQNYRAKIPLVVVSVPASATPPDASLPTKYRFQTQPYSVPSAVKHANEQDDTNPDALIQQQRSVFTDLRSQILVPNRFNTVNATNIVTSTSRLPAITSAINVNSGLGSPTLSAFGSIHRTRRVKSVEDLSSPSMSHSDIQPVPPTPLAPAPQASQTQQSPQNTTSANHSTQGSPQPLDFVSPSFHSANASSEVFPVHHQDKGGANLHLLETNQEYDPASNVAPWLEMLTEEFDMDTDLSQDVMFPTQNDLYRFSNLSIVSKDALSLSSTTTGTTYKTCQSLQSRPVSLAFDSTLGLPPATTIPCQTPYTSESMEESFFFTPTPSSLPDTVASSVVLAGQTQPSLPDPTQKTTAPYPTHVHMHYLNAKLPPLPPLPRVPPTDEGAGRFRMKELSSTTYYYYDSDDED